MTHFWPHAVITAILRQKSDYHSNVPREKVTSTNMCTYPKIW